MAHDEDRQDAHLSESNRCDSSREKPPRTTVPQSAAPSSTYAPSALPSTSRLEPGTRVRTWTDEVGTVRYLTADGWYGVRLDGELVVHEWQADQVTAIEVAS